MPSYLLLENGSQLLLEGSGALLLELDDASGAEDLLSAIKLLFDAGSLPDSITGGLYPHNVVDGDDLPYATVEEAGSHEELRTDSCVVHQVAVTWRVYAEDLDTAGRLADSLVAAFAGQGFTWSSATGDARTSPMLVRTEPRHQRGSARTRGGADCWWQERSCYLRAMRTTL